MGQKVHPYVFRLGQITNWRSRWYSGKDYKKFLTQDIRLRDFIAKKFSKAGIDAVEIERSAGSLNIIIKTARPGLLIGRGGTGAEVLKEDLKKIIQKDNAGLFKKTQIRLEVDEIKKPDIQASIIAQDMAAQIERRLPYRRVMKQALDKVTQNKEVEGVKVAIKGRLNGNEIARSEWLKRGRVPLQTIRANIDYCEATAYTTYGTVGIKVWIYKGEKF